MSVHKTVERLQKHILADGERVVVDLERSQGSVLMDAESGQELVDFHGFIASLPLGYNHPSVVSDDGYQEKLHRASQYRVAIPDIYHPYYADFVEAFASTLPPEFRQHLFFIDGGTLAVENAMKTAMDYKLRRNFNRDIHSKGYQVLHFKHAFHGRSGYCLSVTNTNDPRKYAHFAKFDWPRMEAPALYFDLEGCAHRDVALEEQALAAIRAVLSGPRVDDICAILVEPIQGEGGDRHLSPEFLQGLRDLSRQFDSLLIFDEVQCGFGTTGKWWAFEHHSVAPDLVAFGKKTQTCGIAATGYIDSVENTFTTPSRISSTWGGQLTDMVRCEKIIQVIRDEHLLRNITVQGEYLLAQLRQFAQQTGLIDNVRGRGSFLGFDVLDTPTRNEVREQAKQEGCLFLVCGDVSLRFRPALTIQQWEIDRGLAILFKVLRRVAKPMTSKV
ncbi:aminotransferase class III-fold pyridoxal phosphate-dependent enzyme [Anthocerotibacter panamensis]|uniref:aminotransferase class III-fold pyridoxal phosphate-dependent enzyme n=1 Tax=Anthocerotibacter panamensis TaxID=2857077 RepID=UPI001C40735B|nr:aminotransferase class III-fold pyridoxal phosphate-dependent enzyme [Anthocerotibacter panamensis]